jgi:iron(III) transport system ATP-binding protein
MISVFGLQKTFEASGESVAAIRGVDFEAAAGEIVTLLGPSGCGKTTTLRCIAGLERPTSGRIAVGGQAMVDCAKGAFVPPHKRNLGMVFQSYAIWPHMSVVENVSYALEGKGVAAAERRRRALQALETVQMAHLADRPAPRLSGGQQQRVAIARALVGSPQALLFDEPLSNLDAKLRGEMRNELRRLQRQTGLTSIYVTHDQAEALAISDWIVVMKDGAIVERGRPVDIYRRPKTIFAAQFLGATNLVPGVVDDRDAARGRVCVATSVGRLVGVDPTQALGIGAKVRVSFRPEDLSSAPADERSARQDDDNRLVGTLEFAAFGGATTEAEVLCGEQKIRCLLGRNVEPVLGATVSLSFSPDVCLVLADE